MKKTGIVCTYLFFFEKKRWKQCFKKKKILIFEEQNIHLQNYQPVCDLNVKTKHTASTHNNTSQNLVALTLSDAKIAFSSSEERKLLTKDSAWSMTERCVQITSRELDAYKTRPPNRFTCTFENAYSKLVYSIQMKLITYFVSFRSNKLCTVIRGINTTKKGPLPTISVHNFVAKISFNQSHLNNTTVIS